VYDWSDAVHLNPEVRVYRTTQGAFLEFVVDDLKVPAGGQAVIDPIYGFDNPADYDLRYDGYVEIKWLTDNGLLIGDINGDSEPDLVLTSQTASVFVVFGGSGIATGDRLLNVSSNFNIRYNGRDNDRVGTTGAVAIGDVNGDGFGDLVLGSYTSDYSGELSGSAWVMFSSLIDDVGMTTGNVKAMGDPGTYNIRYDAAAAGDQLTMVRNIAIGDVNGDGLGDLVLGAHYSDSGGLDSGAVWVMFSTLIDDVGTTTGNTKSLSVGGNYNIRYAGAAAGDQLTVSGTLAVGDVNGDGLGDLVAGTYRTANSGAYSGSAWVVLSTLIDDQVGTGNDLPLSIGGNFNIRYDGAAGDYLAYFDGIAIGDLNGDGLGDLVLAGPRADGITGIDSGSVWVMFSTLIAGTGGTGNIRPLTTAANYNIRYDGAAPSDRLVDYGNLVIGDVNGDNFGDLILATTNADPNGLSSGSVWVMFSTLIDNETGTGNNKPLDVLGNFNIRYNGGASSDNAGRYLLVGDVNGDGFGDLLVGSVYTDYNGSTSGSAWVMFSTLIDDEVGTGNIKELYFLPMPDQSASGTSTATEPMTWCWGRTRPTITARIPAAPG
jgi:hypothetical protein